MYNIYIYIYTYIYIYIYNIYIYMYIYPSSRSSSFSWLLGLFWYLVYFWYFSWYIVPHGFGKDDFVLNCIVLYCIVSMLIDLVLKTPYPMNSLL